MCKNDKIPLLIRGFLVMSKENKNVKTFDFKDKDHNVDLKVYSMFNRT